MKEWTDKYNAFNSSKILTHYEHWKPITDGIIPPPLFLSIDPYGGCNLKCSYCNATEAITVNRAHALSREQVDSITCLLSRWNTRAVCVAGGGEPLLNTQTPYLVESLTRQGIGVGLITNGVLLDQSPQAFMNCAWVGCSVDAGTPETYARLKGTTPGTYQRVLDNLHNLSVLARQYGPEACEITYKYLIHPGNYGDLYTAIRNAKEVGCNTFHARPGGDPWFSLDSHEFAFTPAMVEEANHQIDRARAEFEDTRFKVYGVVHKFTDDWKIKHSFSRCYAVTTNCHITPSGRIDLCCDRRGDPSLSLCSINEQLAILDGVAENTIGWGSPRHIQLMNDIKIYQCPRCTYTHVNEMFEHVLLSDPMGRYFI